MFALHERKDIKNVLDQSWPGVAVRVACIVCEHVV